MKIKETGTGFRKPLVLVVVTLLGAFLTNNCKFPYDADVDEKSGLLVIEGGIAKGDTIQTITVSRSAYLTAPEFKPVRDCEVYVYDENGNEFIFSETRSGVYQVAVPDDQLEHNKNYFVRIITPDGKVYESEPEQLLPSPPVDSVYLIREPVPLEHGVIGLAYQFYVDLKGTDEESRYYRWTLSEAYEYHSSAKVSYMYDYVEDATYIDSIYWNDTIHLPDTTIIIDTSFVEIRHYVDSIVMFPVFNADSIYACWKSLNIRGLYTSSTINLETNAKKRIPLHSFTTETDKLNEKYSLLVKQYSLTEDAYAFWSQVKIETEETGGLYTQQPGQVETNLHCVTDENEEVLGYFWASSLATKRIFVKSMAVLRYTYPYCELYVLDNPYAFEPLDLPVYIMYDPEYGREYTTENQSCMNCLLRGGVNRKPDYWDDESIPIIYNY